jgi:hypothetical protein
MGEVQWAPRLAGSKIRRLYQSDASGLLDEDLLDEVGSSLYQRCRSILDVRAAKLGKIRCQECDRHKVETWIVRPPIRKRDRDCSEIVCPVCGWRVMWGDFMRSFKRHQLNSGGALPAFERFVEHYPRLRDPREKMLAVDRLIHEFHYSFRDRPRMPSRPVGPNLIKGKLDEVIALLDELTFGPVGEAGRGEWQTTLSRYREEYLGQDPKV